MGQVVGQLGVLEGQLAGYDPAAARACQAAVVDMGIASLALAAEESPPSTAPSPISISLRRRWTLPRPARAPSSSL